MPSPPPGFAIGIADADKVGIATIAQAARLIKSRRRMGSSVVGRVFVAQDEMLSGPAGSMRNKSLRLHSHVER
jgi:hypothetical protein